MCGGVLEQVAHSSQEAFSVRGDLCLCVCKMALQAPVNLHEQWGRCSCKACEEADEHSINAIGEREFKELKLKTPKRDLEHQLQEQLQTLTPTPLAPPTKRAHLGLPPKGELVNFGNFSFGAFSSKSMTHTASGRD